MGTSSEGTGTSSEGTGTSSEAKVISVAIEGESVVKVGETITLTANVTNSTQGVTWASEHAEIASVSADGVVTGVAKGSTTITATSKEDTSKKAQITITVEKKGVTIKVEILDYATAQTVETSVKETSGAHTIKVTVENLPEGKTMDDVTITWPLNNALHDIKEHNNFKTDKTIKDYTVLGAGRDRLEFKVSISGVEGEFSQVYNFPIERDDSIYTKIETAQQFVDLVEKNDTDNGKYMLMKNIDLTGYINEGGKDNDAFNGTLDGNGYSVKGFTQNPKTAKNANQDGGFWLTFGGILRNIHLEGNIYAENGFTGIVAKELLQKSVVQDVICISHDITKPDEPNDWTWQRNGSIAGMIKGLVMDSVLMESPDGTINKRTITTAPYGWDSQDLADINLEKGHGFMYNVYTNGDDEDSNGSLARPFDPDPSQSWCSTIRVEEFHPNWDYKEKTAADYDLDDTIWTLADGQMPKLAHDGEQAVKLEPTVTISGDNIVKIGADLTLTAEIKQVDEAQNPTFEFKSSEDGVATVTNDGKTATVHGLTAGTTDITCEMTYGGQKYISAVFTVTVESDEHVGQAISNLDELKAYFNGTAESCGKDVYLTDDIDCEGWTIENIGVVGDFTAKFDGAGKKLTNVTVKNAMFNITSGRIFDLTIQGTYTGTAGYGFLCYENKGTISNVHLDITIDAALGATPNAPFAQAGNGTIIDCDAKVRFVEGKACTNYFAVEAGAGATVSNVTVTYYNKDKSGSTISLGSYSADNVSLVDGDAAA